MAAQPTKCCPAVMQHCISFSLVWILTHTLHTNSMPTPVLFDLPVCQVGQPVKAGLGKGRCTGGDAQGEMHGWRRFLLPRGQALSLSISL